MQQTSLTRHFRRTVYGAMVVVWAFTTVFTLSQDLQPLADRFHTSLSTVRLLTVAMSVPTLLIYLSIAFAATTFSIYTQRINGSKEEPGYRALTNGIFLGLGYFVASSLIGVFHYRYGSGQAEINFIIIRNYALLAISLVIYWFFWRGSKLLADTLRTAKTGLSRQVHLAQYLVVILGGLYTYLVFQNPYRSQSPSDIIHPTYGLPDILIVLTIIIPYVLSWLLAATAVANLSFYTQNVKGLIFRQLFGNLSQGFAAIVGLTIVLQMVEQFSEFWANTNLNGILPLAAAIVVALVFAYLQFGLAARRLDKIETV